VQTPSLVLPLTTKNILKESNLLYYYFMIIPSIPYAIERKL